MKDVELKVGDFMYYFDRTGLSKAAIIKIGREYVHLKISGIGELSMVKKERNGVWISKKDYRGHQERFYDSRESLKKEYRRHNLIMIRYVVAKKIEESNDMDMIESLAIKIGVPVSELSDERINKI